MNELVDDIFASCKQDLEKTYLHQQNEYLVIRAGRANPHILDKVMVEYYGVMTPIVQMGTVTVSEARILNINIWDVSQIKNVEKAISQADIGITPTNDGKTIRLVFPTLTEERRKEIVKTVKKICEDTKVAMRNIRRDALDMLKDLKKDSSISEDEFATAEKEVQKLIDKYTALADKESSLKEEEVMKV
ncbi:MAG: ribosome recycling factor [Clostridiales bacterium]|nr:ribosome recycling factor [Clostridiales bacterium]